MTEDVIDGLARLTRDQQLDWATQVASAAINKVLDKLDPDARDRIYAEFRAMDERQRRALVKATLDNENIDLREFARLSPEAVTARALVTAHDELVVGNEDLNVVP